MANAYQPPPADVGRRSLEEEDWCADSDVNVVKLLEENARLRALVVQLSDLVLKYGAGQK